MFVKSRTTFIVVILLSLLVACSDSESEKKRLIATGKKYYDSGKYKEASIIFRKAVQKDARFGEAYYQLGLTELKRNNFGDALRSLRRASELQPENDDAHSKLGDLYISVFAGDPKKYKALLDDTQELSDRLLKRNPKSHTGLRLKGYIALAQNKVKEAVEALRQAYDLDPKDPKVALSLAQVLMADGQQEESEKLALTSLEINKTFAPLYDFLYLNKLRMKKIDDAEQVLKRKLANNSNSVVVYLELATHYLRTGREAEGKAVLAKVTSNTKDFPRGRSTVGDYYYRFGRFQDALAEYQAGSREVPADKLLYAKKTTEVLAVMGKREEALKLAEQLVKDDPEDPEARALRAALRLYGGKKEEVDTAISEFQSVLAKMPNNPVVRFNLGEAYMSQMKTDQAMAQYLEAVKLSPTYIPAKLALGRVYMMRQEHAKSLQTADEIIKLAPNMPAARIMRISSLMALNDGKTARAELQSMVQSNPDFKDARYLLAMLDLNEKKMPDAEAGFRNLANANPPDQRGLFGLSEVYFLTGRVEQAKQLLENELKRNDSATPVRIGLANILVRSAKYSEAIQLYNRLLKENPQSADLYLRIGESYRRAGNLQEAYSHFEKASQISPKDVTPFIQMAAVVEQMGAKEKLKPLYGKILEVSPDNPIALNNLAYMMAESGSDLDQALTYAQKAKQKMPTNLDIADTLGWIYIKKNLSEDAIKIFRDLVDKKPEHVTWRYHLAIALFQKGDKLAAKKELQTALRNNPTRDEDKKIQELLGRIG
jgi:tetratricopeptide (TPR) repeat protein